MCDLPHTRTLTASVAARAELGGQRHSGRTLETTARRPDATVMQVYNKHISCVAEASSSMQQSSMHDAPRTDAGKVNKAKANYRHCHGDYARGRCVAPHRRTTTEININCAPHMFDQRRRTLQNIHQRNCCGGPAFAAFAAAAAAAAAAVGASFAQSLNR